MITELIKDAILHHAYDEKSVKPPLYDARLCLSEEYRQKSLNEALERACDSVVVIARAQGACADEANKEWALQRIARIFDEIS